MDETLKPNQSKSTSFYLNSNEIEYIDSLQEQIGTKSDTVRAIIGWHKKTRFFWKLNFYVQKVALMVPKSDVIRHRLLKLFLRK